MEPGTWVVIAIFALTQVIAAVSTVALLRGRMDAANQRFESMDNRLGEIASEARTSKNELRGDIESLRREVHRIGEGLAHLSGKVNGGSKGLGQG